MKRKNDLTRILEFIDTSMDVDRIKKIENVWNQVDDCKIKQTILFRVNKRLKEL